MKKCNIAVILVVSILLNMMCVPVYATAENGITTYSADVIVDSSVLRERIMAGVNEYQGKEMRIEAGAKYSLTPESVRVVKEERLPTTTQLLKTVEYGDGKVVNEYATAVLASTSSKTGHAEAGTLDVWAIIYWSEQREFISLEYKFNKSEHFYQDSGSGTVSRMEMENYVAYNEVDINGTEAVEYSPRNGVRYPLLNSYTAYIPGGQDGHYEAYTYVSSSQYGTVEAYVRYFTPAA